MIDDNWEDGKYYEIFFKTDQNKKFSRSVIVPYDFPEEEIPKMFQLSLNNKIEVLDICCDKSVWISKKHFKKIV